MRDPPTSAEVITLRRRDCSDFSVMVTCTATVMLKRRNPFTTEYRW